MGRTGRAQLLALQESYADRKIALVTNYGLSIRLNEADPLAVTGEIELLNANSESLETIILSLNPGLKVQSLTVDSAEVAWSREATLIIIKLHIPLGAQETMRIQLAYAGDIDTDAFDLERELGEPRLRKRDGPINKGSMTAWITDSSVFLPSRSRWYPVTGVDYGNESGRPQSFSLATHSLHRSSNIFHPPVNFLLARRTLG